MNIYLGPRTSPNVPLRSFSIDIPTSTPIAQLPSEDREHPKKIQRMHFQSEEKAFLEKINDSIKAFSRIHSDGQAVDTLQTTAQEINKSGSFLTFYVNRKNYRYTPRFWARFIDHMMLQNNEQSFSMLGSALASHCNFAELINDTHQYNMFLNHLEKNFSECYDALNIYKLLIFLHSLSERMVDANARFDKINPLSNLIYFFFKKLLYIDSGHQFTRTFLSKVPIDCSNFLSDLNALEIQDVDLLNAFVGNKKIDLNARGKMDLLTILKRIDLSKIQLIHFPFLWVQFCRIYRESGEGRESLVELSKLLTRTSPYPAILQVFLRELSTTLRRDDFEQFWSCIQPVVVVLMKACKEMPSDQGHLQEITRFFLHIAHFQPHLKISDDVQKELEELINQALHTDRHRLLYRGGNRTICSSINVRFFVYAALQARYLPSSFQTPSHVWEMDLRSAMKGNTFEDLKDLPASLVLLLKHQKISFQIVTEFFPVLNHIFLYGNCKCAARQFIEILKHIGVHVPYCAKILEIYFNSSSADTYLSGLHALFGVAALLEQGVEVPAGLMFSLAKLPQYEEYYFTLDEITQLYKSLALLANNHLLEGLGHKQIQCLQALLMDKHVIKPFLLFQLHEISQAVSVFKKNLLVSPSDFQLPSGFPQFSIDHAAESNQALHLPVSKEISNLSLACRLREWTSQVEDAPNSGDELFAKHLQPKLEEYTHELGLIAQTDHKETRISFAFFVSQLSPENRYLLFHVLPPNQRLSEGLRVFGILANPLFSKVKSNSYRLITTAGEESTAVTIGRLIYQHILDIDDHEEALSKLAALIVAEDHSAWKFQLLDSLLKYVQDNPRACKKMFFSLKLLGEMQLRGRGVFKEQAATAVKVVFQKLISTNLELACQFLVSKKEYSSLAYASLGHLAERQVISFEGLQIFLTAAFTEQVYRHPVLLSLLRKVQVESIHFNSLVCFYAWGLKLFVHQGVGEEVIGRALFQLQKNKFTPELVETVLDHLTEAMASKQLALLWQGVQKSLTSFLNQYCEQKKRPATNRKILCFFTTLSFFYPDVQLSNDMREVLIKVVNLFKHDNPREFKKDGVPILEGISAIYLAAGIEEFYLGGYKPSSNHYTISALSALLPIPPIRANKNFHTNPPHAINIFIKRNLLSIEEGVRILPYLSRFPNHPSISRQLIETFQLLGQKDPFLMRSIKYLIDTLNERPENSYLIALHALYTLAELAMMHAWEEPLSISIVFLQFYDSASLTTEQIVKLFTSLGNLASQNHLLDFQPSTIRILEKYLHTHNQFFTKDQKKQIAQGCEALAKNLLIPPATRLHDFRHAEDLNDPIIQDLSPLPLAFNM